MKANELRIGNYVNEINAGLISIELSNIDAIFYGDINYTPILLTEKWLLDFGFEKFVYEDKDFDFGIEYKLKALEDVFMVFADDFSLAIYSEESVEHKDLGVIPTHKNTIYVHQLQNLYFALTGEELFYKK